jgi:hypothetical protein
VTTTIMRNTHRQWLARKTAEFPTMLIAEFPTMLIAEFPTMLTAEFPTMLMQTRNRDGRYTPAQILARTWPRLVVVLLYLMPSLCLPTDFAPKTVWTIRERRHLGLLPLRSQRC